MNPKSKPTELADASLDHAEGAGFLEPVITRKPTDDRIGYREEFGVERPKPTNMFGKLRGLGS